MDEDQTAQDYLGAWIITVAAEAAADLESVRISVETHGFIVDRVLPTLGQMSGRAGASAVAEVAALAEIWSVDPDTSASVAPPDSPVQ